MAGTLVSTEDGQRAIEEVEAGDKVWAYDEETGGKALKEVEEIFVSETDKLIHVETDKEEIITTELHPFYVEGFGFVQAGCLQEGYELVCLDGGKETITGIRVEWLEEAVEVYNFEVADYHTYFVGDGDVLVHNTTCSNSSGDEVRTYVPSKKHNPQGGWGSVDPIPNVEIGQELLDGAYSSTKNKQLYNIYENNIIKSQPDSSSGEWHAYRVTNTSKEVPQDVLKAMLNDGIISNADYNKLIKNKWRK